MLKNLSKWNDLHKHFPKSYYSWKEVFGEKISVFIGWILCYTNESVDVIHCNGKNFDLRNWESDCIYGYDEDSQCEMEFSPQDVLGLELDKESFAREIARALGFDYIQVDKLLHIDAYCLGVLNHKSSYKIFLCYDLFRAEYLLAKELEDTSKVPIIYCFSENCLSNEFRKQIDVKRGRIFKVSDFFHFGQRKIIQNGFLYPNFKIKELILEDNKRVRFDKRKVAFDERFYS